MCHHKRTFRHSKLIHQWGVLHQVEFDAGKEHFAIISNSEPAGEVFKLLGALTDPKLQMGPEIDRIKNKARAKIKAILRTRKFYSIGALIQQYKTHVLCLLEGTIGAIFHAATTQLEKLDRLQISFCDSIGLSEAAAFLQHNLAPLRLRRNIAALGFLYKIKKGDAHEDFQDFFPAVDVNVKYSTRLMERRHKQQILDLCDGKPRRMLRQTTLSESVFRKAQEDASSSFSK